MRSSGPKRVRVRLTFGPDGVLRGAVAEGHAGDGPKGANPACAAVSALLRGAFETASGYAGVSAAGEATEPGSLRFDIRRFPPEAAERLRGVGDFLCVGLSNVDREYPGLIELVIES